MEAMREERKVQRGTLLPCSLGMGSEGGHRGLAACLMCCYDCRLQQLVGGCGVAGTQDVFVTSIWLSASGGKVIGTKAEPVLVQGDHEPPVSGH